MNTQEHKNVHIMALPIALIKLYLLKGRLRLLELATRR